MYSLKNLLDTNFINDKILSLEILDGFCIDCCILKGNGTQRSSLVEYDFINRFRKIKIELGLIFIIKVFIY